MEPLVPTEGARALEDDVLPLIAESNQLAGRIHPILRASIGDLVRSMNCYYSNLIEGHDTHPRDIDRALANDFSSEPKKRELQKEAVAHIHVQKLIDTGLDPDVWPASATYASWLHKEFCSRLPQSYHHGKKAACCDIRDSPPNGADLRLECDSLALRTAAIERYSSTLSLDARRVA